MLQALRRHRRRLAGNLATLLAAAWLSLALAPCAAAADAADADPHAMHRGAVPAAHDTPSSGHACKHCDTTAGSACAAADGDCGPGIALLRGEAEHGKLKSLALPAVPAALPAPVAGAGRAPPAIAQTVPHPAFTRLYCRFRE